MDRYQLAPYAARSETTRGRQYHEQFRDDRPAYERDRDRVIHSAAFRRLEYKTQVFIFHEGDYYRTRLTHSIEVAQIARGIAKRLGLNLELTETLALAHDLGHTPFGHAGEQELNRLMADHGGFEHNVQGLRIVTLLEDRYPTFPGLNLTWEAREGIIKHATFFDHPDDEALAEYEPQMVATLEAQLINCADSIAYHNHDLDDGLKSGMIDRRHLHENVAIWRETEDQVLAQYGALEEHKLRHMAISTLIGRFIVDLVEQTKKQLAEYEIRSIEDIREVNKIMVGWSSEMETKRHQLNNYLFHHMYRYYNLEHLTFRAMHCIRNLFRAYREQTSLLPVQFRKRVETQGLERTICDYIAGMTDRYAMQEYDRLYNPSSD